MGHDAAPSGAFTRLKEVLERLRFEVKLFVGNGKPLTAGMEEVRDAASNADVVLIGMSSSVALAEVELAAGEAARAAGKPYGFYIRSDEKLILVPGSKFAAGNFVTLGVVMESLSWIAEVDEETHFRLVLALHPGDRTVFAVDPATGKGLGLYGELVVESPIPMEIVEKDVLTTSQMVPGADLIIEFGSSIGIEGAYNGIPVITLAFEVLYRRYEKSVRTRRLEAVEEGLSKLVDGGIEGLTSAIEYLLTPEGFAPLRASQEKACPKPADRGIALRRMASVLIGIAG